jgi:hypothetical protein
VDEHTSFVLFPTKTHDEGVHADVTMEDVVKRQVQGTKTKQMQKYLKRFFFVSKFGLASALFLGDL